MGAMTGFDLETAQEVMERVGGIARAPRARFARMSTR